MIGQREKIRKLKEIADSGNRDAQIEYGILRFYGGEGVVKNREIAHDYLFRNVGINLEGFPGLDFKMGDPMANFYLGYMTYIEGQTPPVMKESVVIKAWHHFYRSAKEGGIIDGMRMLARIGKDKKASFKIESGQWVEDKNLMLPCAWAYLAQARSAVNEYESIPRSKVNQSNDSEKLVFHFEKEERLTKDNPSLLQEALNLAEKWNEEIDFEIERPSIDEIVFGEKS